VIVAGLAPGAPAVSALLGSRRGAGGRWPRRGVRGSSRAPPPVEARLALLTTGCPAASPPRPASTRRPGDQPWPGSLPRPPGH